MQARVPSVKLHTISNGRLHPGNSAIKVPLLSIRTLVNMAAVSEPATERDDGDLKTGPAKEPVLHGREVRGLGHCDCDSNRGQLSTTVCREVEETQAGIYRGGPTRLSTESEGLSAGEGPDPSIVTTLKPGRQLLWLARTRQLRNTTVRFIIPVSQMREDCQLPLRIDFPPNGGRGSRRGDPRTSSMNPTSRSFRAGPPHMRRSRQLQLSMSRLSYCSDHQGRTLATLDSAHSQARFYWGG